MIMEVAAQLELEKRDLFLQRLGAALLMRGIRRPADVELELAMREALRGLIHLPAA